jgi:hypothetical protein
MIAATEPPVGQSVQSTFAVMLLFCRTNEDFAPRMGDKLRPCQYLLDLG